MFFARIEDKRIIIMMGRPHYYQGYSMNEVVYPVKLLSALGVKYLILTNAVGGINPDFQLGDLMLITDHINLVRENPLRGLSSGYELGDTYSKKLISLTEDTALKKGVKIKKGIYAYESGPIFETAAEAKMFYKLGIDAVGWSIVPEAIMARFLGMEILAISCVSDLSYPKRKRASTISEICERSADKLKILVESVAINLNFNKGR
jgi:purine-nucleoside phosphorylase